MKQELAAIAADLQQVRRYFLEEQASNAEDKADMYEAMLEEVFGILEDHGIRP